MNDPAIMPACLALRVTTEVLTLSQLAAAGDAQALAQLEAMAALLPPLDERN